MNTANTSEKQGELDNASVATLTENVNESDSTVEKTGADEAAETQSILDGLAKMPEAQQHAIEAEKADHAARTEMVEQIAAGKTDADGRSFDPNLHEVNPDGTPRLTPKTGKLCKKRGHGSTKYKPAGQAPSANNGPTSGPTSRLGALPPTPGAPAPAVDKRFDPIEIENCAKTATGLFFMCGVVVFGEDGQPIVKTSEHINEPEEVYSAFLTYYKIKGAKEIPPSLVLLVAIGGYGRRRLAMPTVRKRVATFREKIVLWFVKLRLRRGAKNATEYDPEKPPPPLEPLQ